MLAETYQAVEERNGRGTFFLTDCGNTMYSIFNDGNAYHGCICPRCGKTLYIRGSEEAKECSRGNEE